MMRPISDDNPEPVNNRRRALQQQFDREREEASQQHTEDLHNHDWKAVFCIIAAIIIALAVMVAVEAIP